MLDLACDVMQLHMYLVPSWTAPSGRALLPPAGFQPTRAAMTSPAHKNKKKTSQSEGFSTRAHVLCPSVTCTVHSANRTHHAGYVGFYTRAHVKNPSHPNSLPSLTFVRPRDQLHHRVRFRTGPLTLAAVLAGVSPVAQHGPPVRYRADPARSR